MTTLHLLALGLVAAAPAWAQRFEVAPLIGAGYTTSAGIDEHAVGITGLEIKGGFTWGGQVGYLFGTHVGAEVSWSQEETALRISTRDGSADLFDMKLGKLHGNLVYQWGGEAAKVHPFALVGLGASFLSAPDLRSETKLSWAVGGGVKVLLNHTVGVRLQATYKPTRLNDEGSAPVCDPFGFCQGNLHQGEVLGGLMLRFWGEGPLGCATGFRQCPVRPGSPTSAQMQCARHGRRASLAGARECLGRRGPSWIPER